MPAWDPSRYLQFADHRSRPFEDLITQVPTMPATIVDLGCGPGHLTRHLRAHWPAAQILGIDSSAEMIDRAFRGNTDPRTNFDVADVTTWTPPQPFDLMVSNAMFQWVPDQFAVIDRLLGSLGDGGTFAVQVPNNAASATHRTMSDLARDPRFADHLRDVEPLPATDPADYLQFFADRHFDVNAWETTYLHVLDGDDPVFDWMRGTGARPYLQALPEDLRAEFAADLAARLREAYPRRSWGTTLPFRRTFAVAVRS